MTILRSLALAVALTVATAGHAAQFFHLTYTTSVDATSGPAVTVNAILSTDDGQFYGAPGYQVTGITGTRGSQALSFDPNNFDDEIYFPGDASGHYVDSFGLDLVAGGTVYTLYRGPGDFAYHEFDGTTGRLIFDSDIALTQIAAVPEPAAWSLLLIGFGALGSLLRHRRSARAAA